MKKKSMLKILFVFIIYMLILFACSSQKDAIAVGVIGNMTGEGSDLAVSGRRGIEIAVDEFNELGKVSIELIIKDDKNDPEIALLKDKEFVKEDVRFVIGHYTSELQLKTIDYINRQDVLFLGPTVSSDALTGMDDNFIRFIASTREQAVVLSKVAKENEHKKFAIFRDENNKAFNEPLSSNFNNLLTRDGGEVLLELQYDSSDLDSFLNYPRLKSRDSIIT
jgi:branched-chain amino acid transport system substrate-binding protein